MSINSDNSNLSIEEIKRQKKNEYNRLYQKNNYTNNEEFRKKKLEKDKQYQKENKDKVKIWHSNYIKSHREEYNEYKRNYYHTVIKPKRELKKLNMIPV
jgi:hypothetical protein